MSANLKKAKASALTRRPDPRFLGSQHAITSTEKVREKVMMADEGYGEMPSPSEKPRQVLVVAATARKPPARRDEWGVQRGFYSEKSMMEHRPHHCKMNPPAGKRSFDESQSRRKNSGEGSSPTRPSGVGRKE